MPKRKILILFAHPALQKSRVNQHLVRAVCDLEGVTFSDLYEQYPDFDIDVKREQGLLLANDVIVLHHPFYWYSTPAILKEWEDLVLEHGWAYGHEGNELHGKLALNAMTAGGGEDAYTAGGINHLSVRQFLAPIEHSFRLCGVDYLPPFVVHGTHRLGEDEILAHAEDYRRVIEALRDDAIDLEAARSQPRLNADLDRIMAANRR